MIVSITNKKTTCSRNNDINCLVSTKESLNIMYQPQNNLIEDIVTSNSKSLHRRTIRSLRDLEIKVRQRPNLLGNRSSTLHMSLLSHLAGLGGVLGGLDAHHNVLSLTVDTHGTLLADSHMLRTRYHSRVSEPYV